MRPSQSLPRFGFNGVVMDEKELENVNENNEMGEKPKKRKISVVGIVINAVLGVAVLVALSIFIFSLNFSICIVDGDSMNDTLVHEQIVLLGKGEPDLQRGDMIVFSKTSADEDTQYIKRVIAVAGDTVEFRCNYLFYPTGTEVVELYVNGEKVDESYIKEEMKSDYFKYVGTVALNTEYTVSEGCVYALGDNRNNSMDSRYTSIGEVKLTEVVGEVVVEVEKDSFWEGLLKLLFGGCSN